MPCLCSTDKQATVSRRFFVAGIVIEGSIRASATALKRVETKEMGHTTFTHWKEQNLEKIGIGLKANHPVERKTWCVFAQQRHGMILSCGFRNLI